ncbi:MAG: hypothetical protein WC789_06120 [Lentisphaeria bacterium]
MAQSHSQRRYKVPRTPTKSAGKRRQRIKVQKRRLVALGVDAAKVGKLNAQEIRGLLRHPAKLAPAAA